MKIPLILIALLVLSGCPKGYPDQEALAGLLGVSSGTTPTPVTTEGVAIVQSGSVVTEDGTTTTASFTVRLTSQPPVGEDVTIKIDVGDTSEATIDIPAPGSFSGTLTFTNADWDIAQTVTVSGLEDALDDGDQKYLIIINPTVSIAAGYNSGIDHPDLLFTTTDNDTAGVTITPTLPQSVSENLTTTTIDVVLNQEPAADVTIPVSVSDSSEADLSGPGFTNVASGNLIFTAGSCPATGNWCTAQTVTVTGLDDVTVDGTQNYNIIFSNAQSLDAAYNGNFGQTLAYTTSDNDSAGITVTPGGVEPLALSESPAPSGTFTVVLDREPTSGVEVGIRLNDTTEARIDLPFIGSEGVLTFTAGVCPGVGNWCNPQTVTVTGIDDGTVDGNIGFTVDVLPAVSSDANYNTLAAVPASVSFSTSDDDAAGINVTPPVSTVLSESGTTQEFTVVLASSPSDPLVPVSIPITSAHPDECEVVSPSSGSLIFSTSNWSIAQTVVVKGVDDALADGVQPCDINLGPAVASGPPVDPNYDGFSIVSSPLSFTTSDDDGAPGITLSTNGPLAVSETGTTATFTVVLDSEPTAAVTVPVDIQAPGLDEATISGPAFLPGVSGNLAFTAGSCPGVGDWCLPQTVTVSGLDDVLGDGDITFLVSVGSATGGDYTGVSPALPDVTVINSDDDSTTTVGINVLPLTGHVTSESGLASIVSVVLTSMPGSNVIITPSSLNTAEGSVSGAITFTPADWNIPQDVSITGVDDTLLPEVDGNIPYTVRFTPSGDATYTALGFTDVSVTNLDNDAPGIAMVVGGPLSVTEDPASTTSFTLALNTKPSADVKLCLASLNTLEVSLVVGGDVSGPDGDCSQGSVSFVAATWTPADIKTVTFGGVVDVIADGDQDVEVKVVSVVTGDVNYSGLDITPYATTITSVDDDSAGVTVVGGPLALDENDPTVTDSFTVQLATEPTNTVKVCLFSTDTTEATVRVGGGSDAQPGDADCPVAKVVFTTLNYATPQTILIDAVDDMLVDGAQNFNIILTASSLDVVYNAIDPNDVSGTTTDNDAAPGVSVTLSSAQLLTAETPYTDSYTVVLDSKPYYPVKICLESSDLTEVNLVVGGDVLAPDGDCAQGRLEFSDLNWNTPQTVTVTGIDDFIVDAVQPFNITSYVVTLDVIYSGVTVAAVPGENAGNPLFEDFDTIPTWPHQGWVDVGGTYDTKAATNTTFVNSPNSFMLENAVGNPTHTTNGIEMTFPATQPVYLGWYFRWDFGTAAAYTVLRDSLNRYVFFGYVTGGVYANTLSVAPDVPVVSGQWHHVEMVNINWAAKTYDYYFDGVLIQAGTSFRDTLSTDFTKFKFYNFNAGRVYYDDIKILQ